MRYVPTVVVCALAAIAIAIAFHPPTINVNVIHIDEEEMNDEDVPLDDMLGSAIAEPLSETDWEALNRWADELDD